MYNTIRLLIGLNRKTSSSELSPAIHIMFQNTAISFQPVISDKTFHVMTVMCGYLLFKGKRRCAGGEVAQKGRFRNVFIIALLILCLGVKSVPCSFPFHDV